MFDILFKIWFLVVIMPIHIAREGFGMYKEFMIKRQGHWDWAYGLYPVVLVLFILLIILLANGYS